MLTKVCRVVQSFCDLSLKMVVTDTGHTASWRSAPSGGVCTDGRVGDTHRPLWTESENDWATLHTWISILHHEAKLRKPLREKKKILGWELRWGKRVLFSGSLGWIILHTFIKIVRLVTSSLPCSCCKYPDYASVRLFVFLHDYLYEIMGI